MDVAMMIAGAFGVEANTVGMHAYLLDLIMTI
jgi:hypothetical protein